MRRPLAAAIALLALALALPAAPAGAQTGSDSRVQLLPAASERFPQRAFRLTMPEERVVTTDQLTVHENGERVRNVELIPASSGNSGSFGTMLVIDASFSMRGKAIKAAVEAARELARQRTGSQRLGIVVFNREAKVLLDLTDDQAAIDRALAKAPPLAPQTHVFDGVGIAFDALKQAKVAAGTVVVLSDGADTGSRLSVGRIARRSRRDNVRIFTIGLRSRSYNPSELRRLAESAEAGSNHADANSLDDLSAIFRQIGGQLANEYLIRYETKAAPGTEVRVLARIEGIAGFAQATYRAAGDASFVLIEDSFWTSTLGVVTTTGLCALLLALALGMLLMRRLRGPGLRERIGHFVTKTDVTAEDGEEERSQVLTGVVSGTERSLEQLRWWSGFKENVEIAGIKAEPVAIVAFAAAGSLIVMWILAALTGSMLPALAVAVAVPLAIRAVIRAQLERTRRQFADQLPDMLQGIASALRAGHGLVGAMSMVVEGAQDPSLKEFNRVVADERLGVPLDEALEHMRRRMNNRDVQQLALVAELQRETGGNIAEVLDRVTATVRQRAELRRMVRGLTAQGRLSRTVVTGLPIALLGVLSLMSPSYIAPLFTTSGGLLLLLFGAFMVTMGSLVIKKIVDFEV